MLVESRAKLLGHPVHQMLVTFPIGAFGLAVTSDVLHAWTRKRRYAEAAQIALDFGIVTASLAAPFGAMDYFSITPETRAKRVGRWHGLGNVAVLALFGASRWLRTRREAPPKAKYLSGAGFLLTGVTAWLGGELVDRHAVGVDANASLDAASSLTKGQARPIERARVAPAPSLETYPAAR